MCFAKCNRDIPQPLYDNQGAFNEDENPNSVSSQFVIPEGIHEHVDNLYLNFSIEDGILGFFYETSHQVFFVWTSEEAHDMCEYYAWLIYWVVNIK